MRINWRRKAIYVCRLCGREHTSAYMREVCFLLCSKLLEYDKQISETKKTKK